MLNIEKFIQIPKIVLYGLFNVWISYFIIFFIAEFVIMLGRKSKNVEKFKTRLGKNGADFPVCLTFDTYN